MTDLQANNYLWATIESDDASQMKSADVNSEVRDSSPEDLSGVERFDVSDAEGRQVRDSSPEDISSEERFDVSHAEGRQVQDSSPEDLSSVQRFDVSDAEGREVRDSSPEEVERFDGSDAEDRCSLASSGITESSSVLGIDDDNEVERLQSQQHLSPLFPQADISTEAFEVAFMSLVQRHNLTYACQSDILKLFRLLHPLQV